MPGPRMRRVRIFSLVAPRGACFLATDSALLWPLAQSPQIRGRPANPRLRGSARERPCEELGVRAHALGLVDGLNVLVRRMDADIELRGDGLRGVTFEE